MSKKLFQTNDYKYFEDAKKYSKDIKMEFMSELAIAKNGLLTG